MCNTRAATGMVFHNGQDDLRIQKLRDIMTDLLESMQPGDDTPWKMNFIHVFVLFHGVGNVKFLKNSGDEKYSATSAINTRNGNSFLIELIRLGYYHEVYLVSEAKFSLTDDIYNFRNKEGKNAFDVIKQLLE